MAEIELQTVLSSGDLTEIKIAGTGAGDKVLTSDEVDAKIPSTTELVPYTGATNDVDLGLKSFLTQGMFRALDGVSLAPSTGTGINIYYQINNGYISSIDSATSAYKPLNYRASDHNFQQGTMSIGDKSGGNYASFNTIGEIRLYGDATQWEDLRVPVNATSKGGSKDPDFAKAFDNGAGSQGVFTQYFDPSTEEELYFEAQLPHAWKQGSDIEAHIHWIPDGNGGAGEDVCWGLEYTWADIGEVFGNTTIIYGDTNHLSETLVNGKHYLTELGTIDATGKTFSSMMICRVFRDATGAGGTDDYPNDAGLLEIDFHYQVDSFGSNGEYVKYNEVAES